MLSGVFRFSESEMKQKTRDNLVYLAVGLSIVALIVADFFYADTRPENVVAVQVRIPRGLHYRPVGVLCCQRKTQGEGHPGSSTRVSSVCQHCASSDRLHVPPTG